jgi:sulfatase maturation enzyme AslB (radical SAM superfamily)
MIDETLFHPPVQTRRASGGRQSARQLPILTGEVLGGPPAAFEPAVEDELERALGVARTADAAPLQRLRSTKKRTLSRRGILWLGQTCNLHCEFCYFIDRVHDRSHAQHGFMSIEKAKAICRTMVDVYGNTAVDIEGGEPTLYPEIFELLQYCNRIGLRPTLITNGLVLDRIERCRRYQDAGVNDFKVSIHGLGEVHDRLVGRGGAHLRQMRALRNLQEIGIPFRFNVVLTPQVVRQIPDVARLAVETGAWCVNWLGFNPHEDQETRSERFRLIPRFADLRAPLAEAMDLLEAAGLETNVRYVPHCMVEARHRKNVYHFQQLFYDHREWDWASWAWTTLPPQRETNGSPSEPIALSSLGLWFRIVSPLSRLSKLPLLGRMLSSKRLVNDPSTRRLLYRIQRLLPARRALDDRRKAALYQGVARVHARVNCATVRTPACRRCAASPICSGIYRDYAELFGVEEPQPIQNTELLTDPLHYIRNQSKLVEKHDEHWA